MSRFKDASNDVRCEWTIKLRDGTTAQCGRKKCDGGYCKQHAEMAKRTSQLSGALQPLTACQNELVADRAGSINRREIVMKQTKIERTARFFARMSELGFSYSEAQSLRRIEMTLQRWGEAECGNSNDFCSWAIEREEIQTTFEAVSKGSAVCLHCNETCNLHAAVTLNCASAMHGKPYMVTHPHTGKAYRRQIPDREAGALKRLARIMAKHPELWSYHQGDCRGCNLYIGRKSDLNGHDLSSNYTRGFAVHI